MELGGGGGIASSQHRSFIEFPVVLIVDVDDGRLFPLVGEGPSCLLPIANRKLLTYQFDMLSKSGVLEVFVAAPIYYEKYLTSLITHYHFEYPDMRVELVLVDNMQGSADALRAVAKTTDRIKGERLKGDFICMGSDMFSKFTLGDLANLHRMRTSDVTMMLAALQIVGPDKKGGVDKVLVDPEDQEFIGVSEEDGRIVMKQPVMGMESELTFNKPLLHHCGSLTVRSDLSDVGIYIFSHWVLDFIKENEKLKCVRTEIVPFLVARQFQSMQYMLENVPAIRNRTRVLASLEPWLVASTATSSISSNTGRGRGQVTTISLSLSLSLSYIYIILPLI